MNVATRALIAAVDWAEFRTSSGNAAGLPQAFEDLLRAASETSARAAYWRIDNHVVVQGQLYEAAVPALEVLLSMAPTISPGPARSALAELIQQIVYGQPDASEVGRGNTDIAFKCRALASEANWIFYGWLEDTDSDVRECALLTLVLSDANEERKAAILAAHRKSDLTPGVQKIYSQIDRGLL